MDKWLLLGLMAASFGFGFLLSSRWDRASWVGKAVGLALPGAVVVLGFIGVSKPVWAGLLMVCGLAAGLILPPIWNRRPWRKSTI